MSHWSIISLVYRHWQPCTQPWPTVRFFCLVVPFLVLIAWWWLKFIFFFFKMYQNFYATLVLHWGFELSKNQFRCGCIIKFCQIYLKNNLINLLMSLTFLCAITYSTYHLFTKGCKFHACLCLISLWLFFKLVKVK